ncbi:MAG: cytochrome b N-terminal domain-containing protein [Deltaproteobacteria bacterium]
MSRLTDAITNNRVWRSIIRHGYPDTNKNRSLLVFSNFFLHAHPPKARLRAFQFTRTFYLGGLSIACFALLIVTGTLLMFFYRPAVPQAYHDMKDIEFVVFTGMFQRNLHRWAAHAMVALVFLHMAVTFYRKAYRTPREFNWVIGVFLFVGTVLLSYTGYLLPWDQLAYWAVTVGTNMAGATPYIGDRIKLLLLGADKIGESALIRFYVLHCVVLPLLVAFGIGVHIWRIRKDRGIYLPPRPIVATSATGEKVAVRRAPAKSRAASAGSIDGEDSADEPTAMTFPHLLLRESIAFVAITFGLTIWALLANAPLEDIANPDRTPNPAKSPWYFLGLQELLHYWRPAISGVFLPVLTLVALAAIPYFQVNLDRRSLWESRRGRTFVLLWAAIGVQTALFWKSGAHPVWPIMIPLWAIGALMSLGAVVTGKSGPARAIRDRSLAFWIFTWFIVIVVVLTVVGTFFRGPGWSFVYPWRSGLYL